MKKVWITRLIITGVLHYNVDNMYAEIFLLIMLCVTLSLVWWAKRRMRRLDDPSMH